MNAANLFSFFAIFLWQTSGSGIGFAVCANTHPAITPHRVNTHSSFAEAIA